MEEDKFWHVRKDFSDGRTAFVVVRMFNTIITIGKGTYTYDDQW